MKLFAPILAAAGAVLLASCATPPGPLSPDSYQAQYDALEAECQAREGLLRPTGTLTGYPQRDYACRLGNATRIPPAR
jgi:hypothetical protein